MEKNQDHNDCVTTNEAIVDVRDEELNRLKKENEKLKEENEKLRKEINDLSVYKSLYNTVTEQNKSLSARIEAIKNILEI